jgi:phosphoglucomutase
MLARAGLRKKTREFMTENYLANFVQSVFTSLEEEKTPMKGGTLVISGDGRYFNRDAVQIIAKIAVAHGVSRLWIGQVCVSVCLSVCLSVCVHHGQTQTPTPTM